MSEGEIIIASGLASMPVDVSPQYLTVNAASKFVFHNHKNCKVYEAVIGVGVWVVSIDYDKNMESILVARRAR